MADQQTNDRQLTGKPALTRGMLLMLCLVFAAILVTIWIKLASKDVKVEVAIKRAAIERNATVGESKTAKQGKWYVSLASFRLKQEANAMLKHLEQKGIKADYISFIGSRKNYTWHRIRVTGFASEKEAQEQLAVLSRELGIRNAWVGKEP
jgi:uncharacterized protein (DUF58 family)